MRILLALFLVGVVLAADGTNRDQWNDNEKTTHLWTVIMSGEVGELKSVLESDDKAANTRSADGRGPLWWAYEYGQSEMVKLLLAAGADPNQRDGDGKRPEEVTSVGPTEFMKSASAEPEAEEPTYDAADDEDDE